MNRSPRFHRFIQRLSALRPNHVVAWIVGVSLLFSVMLTELSFLVFETSALFVLIARVIAVVVPLIAATPIALVIAALLRELRAARLMVDQLTHTDGATGTLSRWRFVELATREVRRIRHDRATVSALLVRLVGLPEAAASAGPHSRDLVLQTVADACRTVLRPTDLLARWTDLEFIALTRCSSQLDALDIAGRMQRAIHSATEPLMPGARALEVQINIGVSQGGEDSVETLDDLIAHASRAHARANDPQTLVASGAVRPPPRTRPVGPG